MHGTHLESNNFNICSPQCFTYVTGPVAVSLCSNTRKDDLQIDKFDEVGADDVHFQTLFF
jgi:hypothetical protein